MADDVCSLIGIRVDVDGRINFAMQQNDVPLVKSLCIENRSEVPLRECVVRLTTEPGFAHAWSTRVASVGAQSTYNLGAVDLELSPGFLGEVTERVRGILKTEVLREGEVLAHLATPVELLARNEWGGLSSLPEILAAFIMPNHPAIEGVLRSAAESMSRWTSDPSLNGYQSQDRRRAYTMAAAIYAALQQHQLTYVNPPASFENEGQRVRLPDQILDSRMATCLDIALMAAGCLEQAGLNALVVLVRGHAFTGVWLHDDSFSEPAVDDCLRLRKRVELGEIAVFDPTGVTTRPALDFERAVAEAKRRLEDDETFLCAIDIRRARKGHIRPLPERATRARNTGEGDSHPGATRCEPAAPDVSALKVLTEQGHGERELTANTPSTRLDRWRRKLLDLSLRNRLLNFRDTKKSLPLLCPDLGQLEDILAGGADFRILSRPAVLGERDPRDPATHLLRTGKDALRTVLSDELSARRLHADTTAGELERRMIEIFRAARLGMEEGGASALYLAIGFLAWYETDKSEQRRLAPILLLPLELNRKSVREGFTLRLTDDDPRINVTLLELLKQDFGLKLSGLDPLPEDSLGLDVAGILRTMRQAVRDIDRWDVVEEARIGLFSFTKFLMWRDLSERVDDLLKNPIVEHLVNRPDQPFKSTGEFPRADRLDDERSPADTFCPLPADSSQLAAVFAAAQGRSFVLEGPPGTGKSQTITNLIAHCLAQGKTILFVSEKMAALNVVHRRLVGVGLGRYCLELHSNKANKQEVIGQLAAALGRGDTHDDAEWGREARHLAGLRTELNAYAGALHQRHSTGETVFQATSRMIGLRDAPRVDLRWTALDSLDADALAALRELVERLATAGATCGTAKGHAWEAARNEEWTPGWEENVHRAVAELRRAAETLGEHARVCASQLGLGDNGWSIVDLELIRELAEVLVASPAPPTALLVRPDWEEIERQIEAWLEHGRARDRLRAEVRQTFRDQILQLDLDDLRTRLAHADASWWPASWWRRRPILHALKGVAVEAKLLPKHELAAVLDCARALRDEQRSLDVTSDEARALLGRCWNDGEAKWEGISQLRDWARELRGLALRAAGNDFERGASLRVEWARLANEGRGLLVEDGRIGREFVAYAVALAAFKVARTRVVELLDLDMESAWGAASTPDALGTLHSCLTGWEAAARQLRDWCAWRRVRADAMRSNLAPLVDSYERGTIQATQLRPAFERSYTQWWHSAITDREPVLSGFFSPEHERKIGQFREMDAHYMNLTQGVVQARLAQRVPTASSSVLQNSEMGILKREVAKKRRHMSIRKLLQAIPTLLPRLKPCLMMSPMSVAQYLDASFPPFDIVVFDEASQIPVWDAVGAIARGRQAVIAGDPKQLPPTTFFQRAEDDEETEGDEVAVEDLESILDDCIGAQVPWLPLDWHYRSRHESLITFSNYHYYGNRLLTFPSPAREGLGVSWHPVPSGVYDLGKTRTNRVEADAVVSEILRRLRDPELARLSIGVVTFSQAQQTLIEDLLDAARAADPQLDPYFAEGLQEPVFVKNLENVQGDERDVILFSICYGPDASGRVSMNFGPMNREGGERRLNVAITRARREVIVFSTLKADQINLARTRARGAADLKRFLEYAERGPSAIAEAIALDPDADFDSPFEMAVSDALTKSGWDVHRQVGCARYRIDLAVVDPNSPGRYLLGIECDGANYHRAKTARDRDKLREGVLRDLGWQLHRIWSTDWWMDPEREVRKLEEALQRAREVGSDNLAPRQKPGPSGGQPERKGEVFAAAPLADPIAPAPESAPPALEFYRPTECVSAGSQIEFYERGADLAIGQRLVAVVRQEGPVSLALAARRVAEAWGFERVRSSALSRVRDLIPRSAVHLQATDAGEFLWPQALDPAKYARFRVPSANGMGTREPEDLPLEEIGNAVAHLLDLHGSAPLDEVVRETARLFGFQRVGRVVEERIRKAIEGLVAKGSAGCDAGMVSLRRETGPS